MKPVPVKIYSLIDHNGTLKLIDYPNQEIGQISEVKTSEVLVTSEVPLTLETSETVVETLQSLGLPQKKILSKRKKLKSKRKYNKHTNSENENTKRNPKKSTNKNEEIKFKFRKQFKEYKRKQLFRKAWLHMEEFRDWLEESIMPDKARCKACCKDLTSGKSELLNHRNSKKHRSNFYKMLSKDRDLDPIAIEIPLTDNENDSIDFEETHDHNYLSDTITKFIDFRSDSLSTPNAIMKQIMGETDVKKMKTVADLEEISANTLEKEDALFFPTPTMANFVAALGHCQSKGSTVFCGNDSEMMTNGKAFTKLGGLCIKEVENKDDGSFSVDDLEALLKETDYWWPLQHLVCIETSHLRKGGVVPPVDWIKQIASLICTYNFFLHCDGSRLLNASLYLNMSLAEVVRECHSVTLALDKSLGAPLGAVLAGDFEFIQRCRSLRKSLGGQIHNGEMFASAGIAALRDLHSVENDHRRALALSIALSQQECKQIRIDRSIIQTNILNINLKGIIADDFLQRLSCVMPGEPEQCDGNEIGILGEKIDDSTVSLRMHNNITDQDILLAKRKLKCIMEEYKQSENDN